MLDLLIKNATIVDGTGAKAYQGDLGISESKIILDASKQTDAKKCIDATGLYVCPGFIDAHSHGDGVYGTNHGRLCKTSQGITTEITGQCGSSLYPVIPEHEQEMIGELSTIVRECDLPQEFHEFSTFERYAEYVDHVGLTCNTKILLGHGSLRVSVMGYQNRKCTEEELEKMKAAVREAMEHGALGISSGLIYSPSCYADTEELIELCKVVAEYGGVYATHMRNESYDVINAIKEALKIGKEANIPVIISHHKIQGRPQWGLSKDTLALIQKAKDEGQKITLDEYPYLASMTNINAIIPPKYFANGVLGLAKSCKDPKIRAQMKADITNPETKFENQYINCGGFEHIQIASLKNTDAYDGMTIAEAAAKRGQDQFEALFDILAENDAEGTCIYFSMCDDDLCNIFTFPDTIVGSDGLYRFNGEKGHPRAWGTFPHAFCHFHKEKHLVSVEEMIRKMTSLPCERLGLINKGAIKDGWDADLVIFDYDKFQDKADYTHPDLLTEGVKYVIVNGEIVYHDKKLTGNYPGKLIRHSKYQLTN